MLSLNECISLSQIRVEVLNFLENTENPAYRVSSIRFMAQDMLNCFNSEPTRKFKDYEDVLDYYYLWLNKLELFEASRELRMSVGTSYAMLANINSTETLKQVQHIRSQLMQIADFMVNAIELDELFEAEQYRLEGIELYAQLVEAHKNNFAITKMAQKCYSSDMTFLGHDPATDVVTLVA